jgi:hypothetical protein
MPTLRGIAWLDCVARSIFLPVARVIKLLKRCIDSLWDAHPPESLSRRLGSANPSFRCCE